MYFCKVCDGEITTVNIEACIDDAGYHIPNEPIPDPLTLNDISFDCNGPCYKGEAEPALPLALLKALNTNKFVLPFYCGSFQKFIESE